MSSGFISENIIEQKRKERQDEWERVRKPDQPKDAPEEPYDSRSLFDRLQEQKTKKQDEWEESRKLKNQVRGLESDETEFLDRVDTIKLEQERLRMQEENNAIEEYKKAQEEFLEKQENERKKKELEGNASKKLPTQSNLGNQAKLLSGLIVRKRNQTSESSNTEDLKRQKSGDSSNDKVIAPTSMGALAGLGDYASDSDSE